MTKARVYRSVFDDSEVEKILNYFQHRPTVYVNPNNGNIDKNLDYNRPVSAVHRLIQPKITNLLGEHTFQNGSYKECVVPYPTHIDNQAWWEDKAYTFDTDPQHECFLLIPLVSDARFRTVMFDILSTDRLEIGAPMPATWLGDRNNLEMDDFSHCELETQTQIAHLPVELDVSWQAGDVIRWHRNQLHCSTNFARYGLVKKFILLGIG